MSDKFKHSYDGFRYFVRYKEDEIIKPLCIDLPQMTGYIRYFENGRKIMSFAIKDDDMLNEYNEIFNRIKGALKINFNSMPIYNKKYTSSKIRELNDAIKTKLFS